MRFSKYFKTILLVSLFTSQLTVTQFAEAQTIAEQKAILEALYDATDGDNWWDNTNWKTNKPLGDWDGVTTDAAGNVTDIILDYNGLKGTIPKELGNLSNLESLLLRSNQLSGIPPELGNLSKLTKLDLHNNKPSGSIPKELGKLSKLTYLYLNNNQLTGSIPKELGNLSKLTRLGLSGNQLSGSLEILL